MKVALVYPTPFGDGGVYGGGERYARELGRAMASATETVLVTTGRRRESQRDGPLRIEVYPWIRLVKGLRHNPLCLNFLASLIRVDVVHCLSYHTLLTDLSVIFGRMTGKRVFITDVGGGGSVSLARLVDVTRLAHALLLISEGASRTFTWAQRRRTVIWGGVDLDRFSPGPEKRERRVLYVGRLLPHKGVHNLIEAVGGIVPLTIVGHIYDQGYFKSLLRRAEGKAVSFLSDAADVDVIREYRRSAVSVLPSAFPTGNSRANDIPELLGFTLLESMACATPVVCTDVANLAGVVTDGVDGLVVPPNDAQALRKGILTLLDDPVRSRKMGSRGRQTVLRRFTWPSVVERCLTAYHGAA